MQTFTTGSHPAVDPAHDGIGHPWRLLVAGLLFMALVSAALRPVCMIDVRGTPEPTCGVRHVKHGGTWYHCEPWIRRALSG